MLCLSRKPEQKIRLVITPELIAMIKEAGCVNIDITVLQAGSDKVRLGVTAPVQVRVWRTEILERNPGAALGDCSAASKAVSVPSAADCE
jgi:sRNA-binding carbon storage regulator CsrA